MSSEGCPQCGEKRRTSHLHDGDEVCRSCGCVLEERSICEEWSVRVFADDPASADRVHYSRPMSTFEIEESLTENEKEETEKEFLMNGRRDINKAMDRLFPDSRPSGVLHRARELFDRSFVYQRDQKLGKVEFESGQVRKNYSRRKAFVVASMFIGILENNILIPKPLLQLNHAIEGKDVSELSVRRCLKEFRLPPSYLRNIQQKCQEAQPKFLPKHKQRPSQTYTLPPPISSSSPTPSPLYFPPSVGWVTRPRCPPRSPVRV